MLISLIDADVQQPSRPAPIAARAALPGEIVARGEGLDLAGMSQDRMQVLQELTRTANANGHNTIFLTDLGGPAAGILPLPGGR